MILTKGADMKRLIILAIMLMTLPTMAAEPQQTVENNQSYFTANLQKQPEKDNKQKIGNHFSFFVVNVQINGKIKDIADTDKK